MLSLLVPLLAVLTAPAAAVPSPSASSSPSSLHEIGRVQSLTLCSALVGHANVAINNALDDDRQLYIVINRLRTADVDAPNEISRRNEMSDLATLASRIRLGAAAGTIEIKHLRSIVGETTEPARRVEIKAFTDALSGALVRQRKAGADLDRTLAIIDGRRAVEEINTPDAVSARAAVGSDPISQRNAPVLAAGGIMRSPVSGSSPAPVNGVLRAIADDFATRSREIAGDEGVAADHALGAMTGC